MKFETARRTVKVTLAAAAAFCLLSLILRGEDRAAAEYMLLAGGVCLAVCVFFMLTGLKCPYCGKRILGNSMNVTVCPHCRRDLKSGITVKHKKRK